MIVFIEILNIRDFQILIYESAKQIIMINLHKKFVYIKLYDKNYIVNNEINQDEFYENKIFCWIIMHEFEQMENQFNQTIVKKYEVIQKSMINNNEMMEILIMVMDDLVFVLSNKGILAQEEVEHHKMNEIEFQI